MRNSRWLVFLCCMGVSAAAAAAAPGNELQPLDCLIEPHTTVDLSFSVEGVVESISVDRSDVIEAGQELARLESTVEQATVDQASVQAAMEGEILARQATLRFASSNLTRVRELYAKRSASINDKEQAETELTLARMDLKKAQEAKQVALQNLRRAEAVLERRRLKSPISGVVVERFVPPGEFVKENPVLKIAQLDPLRVEVIAPAEMFGRIRPGMTAKIMPESPIEGSFAARVTVVDRLIDAASGTFGIRLELPNADQQLPGGLRCQVKFPAAKVAARKALKAPLGKPVRAGSKVKAAVPRVADKEQRSKAAPPAAFKPLQASTATGSQNIGWIKRYHASDSAVLSVAEKGSGAVTEPAPAASPVSARLARPVPTPSLAPKPAPQERSEGAALKKQRPPAAQTVVSLPPETVPLVEPVEIPPVQEPIVPRLTTAVSLPAASPARPMSPTTAVAVTARKQAPLTAPKSTGRTARASASGRNRSLGKSCAVLGPFSTRQQIELAHIELDSGKWKMVKRRYKNIELDGYSVFAPPQASSEVQQALLARLAAQNINDFMVLKRGRYRGRVALGHFEQRARAEKHRSMLKNKGFDAVVETRFRTRVGHWLEMKPSPVEVDAHMIVERLEATWPGLDLDLNDCSGDKTPMSSKKIVKR